MIRFDRVCAHGRNAPPAGPLPVNALRLTPLVVVVVPLRVEERSDHDSVTALRPLVIWT